LGGWGSVALAGWLMDGLQQAIYGSASYGRGPSFLPLICLGGLAATHCLRMVIHRGRWLDLSGGRLAIHYAAALVVLSFGLAAFDFFFLGESPGSDNRMEAFTVALLVNSSLIGAWMAIYFLMHFQNAYHRAEAKRALLNEAYAKSQVEALTQQINPHFLFNALNSVRALIPADLREPREAVTQLAEILRAILRSGRQPAASLEGEMEIVRDYLGLQKLRFGDHLQVVEKIDSRCLAAEIPTLLLLTIVENAIKHGVQSREEQATVCIHAGEQDGMLRISVESPAARGRVASEESLGIGLHNAQERLRLAYGDTAEVKLFADDPVVTKCVLTFPWRVA
jgi:LytS/YehU family sensor histidine kinase